MVSLWPVVALALAIPVEDVTLPSGVRVIVSVDHSLKPPEVVVSRDRSLVVVVGDVDPEKARAPYAAWPGASPVPSPPPDSAVESWQVRRGPAALTIDWLEAPPADLLLALQSLVAGGFERRTTTLSYRVDGGWPPTERRAFDAQVERLAAASPRELIAVRDRCLEWATPKSGRERAERLLQVTLMTGNPRLVRELPERCARLTEVRKMTAVGKPTAVGKTTAVGKPTLSSAAKLLLGRGRRVRMIIP